MQCKVKQVYDCMHNLQVLSQEALYDVGIRCSRKQEISWKIQEHYILLCFVPGGNCSD